MKRRITAQEYNALSVPEQARFKQMFLDESFLVGGGEDTSFCVEAENAGWKVLQVPETAAQMVDKGDPSLPVHQQQMWVCEFPIWHSSGETVSKVDGFQEVFARNSAILRERYGVNIERAQQIEGWMADSELEWLAKLAKNRGVIHGKIDNNEPPETTPNTRNLHDHQPEKQDVYRSIE
jgi:hypothetical protein